MVYHSSAMEDKLGNGILCSRPFGGTAILVRKTLDIHCNQVLTNNPRITCVSLTGINNTDIIFSSVYMPWSDRSPEQVIEYEATLGHMQSIVDRHVGCSFLFGGDFNVTKNFKSTCCQALDNFCTANRITWLNSGDDNNSYTYHCDTNSHYSLLLYL